MDGWFEERLEVRDSERPELAVFLDDDERSGATLGQRTGVHADAVGREALDDRAVT